MVTRRQRGLSPCSYTRKVQGSHQRRHHLQYCGEGQRGRFLKIPLILNLIFHSRCEYSFDKNLPSDHRGIAKFVSNSELRHPHDLEENRKSKVEQGAPTSSCLGHRGSSWEEVGDGDLTELTWVRILQPIPGSKFPISLSCTELRDCLSGPVPSPFSYKVEELLEVDWCWRKYQAWAGNLWQFCQIKTNHLFFQTTHVDNCRNIESCIFVISVIKKK